jgi:hypothetical protein
MPLNTKIAVNLAAILENALDLSNVTAPLNLDVMYRLASGTTANKADKLWHDQVTLAASGTADLDLAAGLTDPFGALITFVKLKGLMVKADAGNANNVNISRPAANGVPLFAAASDAIPVLPDGLFLWVAPGAGITVTPGTGDLITFTNSAGGSSVTYKVTLFGTSA